MLTSQGRKALITTQPSQPQDAAERTQRHMRMCAELADLAMGMARAAAARALADWAEPEQPPPADQQLNESAEPLTQPAEPHAAHEPAPHTDTVRSLQASRPATSAKPTDPALLFTRLAAIVRDCIALEARLAASAAGTSNTSRAPLRQPPDPRRPKLQEALRLVTTGLPDRAALLRETTARADEHLAADPDQTIEIPDLLINICEELGIEINFKTLPDEFLFTNNDPIDVDAPAPDPRATSPP